MRRSFAGLTVTRLTLRRDFVAVLPCDLVVAATDFFFADVVDFDEGVDEAFLDFAEDEEDCVAPKEPLRKNAARRTAITLMRDIELQVVYQRKFAPKMDRSLSPRIRTSSWVK